MDHWVVFVTLQSDPIVVFVSISTRIRQISASNPVRPPTHITLIFFQGCGYPPRTVCKDFTDEYALNGTTFKCFVSRADPGLVIVNLDLDQV